MKLARNGDDGKEPPVAFFLNNTGLGVDGSPLATTSCPDVGEAVEVLKAVITVGLLFAETEPAPTALELLKAVGVVEPDWEEFNGPIVARRWGCCCTCKFAARHAGLYEKTCSLGVPLSDVVPLFLPKAVLPVMLLEFSLLVGVLLFGSLCMDGSLSESRPLGS